MYICVSVSSSEYARITVFRPLCTYALMRVCTLHAPVRVSLNLVFRALLCVGVSSAAAYKDMEQRPLWMPGVAWMRMRSWRVPVPLIGICVLGAPCVHTGIHGLQAHVLYVPTLGVHPLRACMRTCVMPPHTCPGSCSLGHAHF